MRDTVAFITWQRIAGRVLGGIALVGMCTVGGPWMLQANAQTRQGAGGRLGPGRQGLQPELRPEGGSTPGDLQQLMDAMVVVQAEKELQLSDDQFAQFLRRLKVLQAARRRGDNQRNRALMELRRLMQNADGKPDEGQVRERLQALDEVETQSAAEARQARASLDQILDVRQQARFRLLEEQIERRKLELFARSRQARQATPPK
jgi:hypothetical protein